MKRGFDMKIFNVITKFQAYDFNSETFQHLNVFLEMKNKFIMDNSLNSRIDMKLTYVLFLPLFSYHLSFYFLIHINVVLHPNNNNTKLNQD